MLQILRENLFSLYPPPTWKKEKRPKYGPSLASFIFHRRTKFRLSMEGRV